MKENSKYVLNTDYYFGFKTNAVQSKHKSSIANPYNYNECITQCLFVDFFYSHAYWSFIWNTVMDSIL